MEYNALNIQRLFIKSFEKYINDGYVRILTEINLYDSQNLDSIRIQLKDEEIGREFSFRFQTYNGYDKAFIAEFVWFSIDSKDSLTRLNLGVYWQLKKGKQYRITSLINQVKGSSFEERLRNYFEMVKDTLENDLKSVVEGKEWIEINYDPRDDYL